MTDMMEWRAPPLLEGEELIFDEPGRVLTHTKPDGTPGSRVCYSAYHFRLVRPQFGGYVLRVKTGLGVQSFALGHEANTAKTMEYMTPDARFHLMHTLMELARDYAKDAAAKTAGEYCKAFADGRLKKRKQRGKNAVDVWIEAAPAQPSPTT